MLSRVLRTIREHRLLGQGDRVLVAVSGGPDSLALLHALVHLGPRLGLTVEAATVNHQLREAAGAEAAAVARHCATLGVPCTVLAVDVAAERGPHVSLQDAARRARLSALQKLAAAHGCARVALGHTADDQAETILFRIIRGTGVAGLSGIPYRRAELVRPLLDTTRAQVLRHLARLGVAFTTDPANSDRRFTRSRVRHDLLPLLRTENPRVVEALLTLGRSARRSPPLAPEALAGLPPLGARAAERIRGLVEAAQGTHLVTVPGGVIEVAYGRASFRPRGSPDPFAAPAPGPEGDHGLPVPGPGRYRWPPGPSAVAGALVLDVVGVTRALCPEGPGRRAATFVPEALADGACVLRAPRPGDRMRPRGGRGSRKLQDLLVDAKVPRALRARLPVLTTGTGTILFVPGLRPSDEARPGPDSEAWVEIRVR